MLTHEKIVTAVESASKRFPVKSARYFGSYANGQASETSDLDLLVEFTEPVVSLLTIAGLKYALEEELRVPVDVIHAPLPDTALIQIDSTVTAYEAA